MHISFPIPGLSRFSQTAKTNAVVIQSSSWQDAVEALEPDLLQLGDSGDAVQQLQVALNALSLLENVLGGWMVDGQVLCSGNSGLCVLLMSTSPCSRKVPINFWCLQSCVLGDHDHVADEEKSEMIMGLLQRR